MANSTNVPLPTFTAAGLAVPSSPDVLQGVMADYVSAFAASGKALSTELTTPQGQLAQSQAYMLTQLNAALLQLIANVDPATSTGAYQDALGRIYFLSRQPATYATVTGRLTGVVGTVVPAGSQARSPDGTIWATVNDVTFGATGTASVTLQATVPGAGPSVGIDGLSIYQQVAGWEDITNVAPSTPGVDVESTQAFEDRRAASVNIGGVGTAASVRAAVANVPGVSDVYVYNNGGDSAITYGTTSYPIPAHSIAITVAGGSDNDVANAIHSKLDAGCGLPTSGGVGTLTNVIVVDSVNYAQPYPQYVIRFVRPLPVNIYMRVEVANLTTLPSTYIQDVQTAVANALSNGYSTTSGDIAVSRARIGGQIVAAAYASAVLALGRVNPVAIYVGRSPNPTSGQSLTLGIDELPVAAALNITVAAVNV
ncbi:hypothetical protein [Xanthomonas phage XPP1]|uniref:Baseplate protein J-like barrel domain-containing protein n=1 Tax=Xanthomonas phage XPP1 TaxID=2099853 RepID=A0A3S7HD72_9CAUD|nr:baseplate wedge subunit [Xanthomonas phage XPP1]AVO23769.1 hypothetical protein [Xanthomonas phage XPP2]AVO23847.1 hypothetical protein [Xanthomonas phage XPP3]AVO23937.1 hypothetical protein [Xanthomonas phage XPP4]AVO24049.1 hypothetical protein [Xanthomonas phage XPP8]QRI46374.1 hypothetical protein [Xanthomonas phage X2]